MKWPSLIAKNFVLKSKNVLVGLVPSLYLSPLSLSFIIADNNNFYENDFLFQNMTFMALALDLTLRRHI
jgi:hypothetical protein